MSPGEAQRVRGFAAGSVARHSKLNILMLEVKPESTGGMGCVFLDGTRCVLHAERGPMSKPMTCRRFPFGLIRTPSGPRVTTEHRCPCRTLGDRPLLDQAQAREAVSDASGRLRYDNHIPQTVRLDEKQRVRFGRYEDHEAVIITNLLAPGDPIRALGAEPFPALDGVRWQDIGHLYRSQIDGSTGGGVLAWFGDELLALLGDRLKPRTQRPWKAAFDRAEARSVQRRSIDEILADWAADALWSLGWLEHGPLSLALQDLATRIELGRSASHRLVKQGYRPDRAAAEAVMMVELAGALPLWGSVLTAMREASKRG
jgi:hypothetical protein